LKEVVLDICEKERISIRTQRGETENWGARKERREGERRYALEEKEKD